MHTAGTSQGFCGGNVFFFQQITLKKTYPAEQRQLRSFELGKDGCCSDKPQQGACGQLKMGSTVNDIQHHRTSGLFLLDQFLILDDSINHLLV
jgi:hypothetical protein